MKYAITWMCSNPVAANLLMLIFIFGGLFFGSSLKQQVYPEFNDWRTEVSVVYPGAGPTNVESGICLPLEEALASLESIGKIECTAQEERGVLFASPVRGADPESLKQDIKTKIDGISTLPSGAETPQVRRTIRGRQFISAVLYGNISERSLREQAELIREDLLSIPNIDRVELGGIRPYEISIEVNEAIIGKYGITLQEVADRVREASDDADAGLLRTPSGEVLLRTNERRMRAREFSAISIVSLADGTNVKLSDIANISDGFADSVKVTRFDGVPAIYFHLSMTGAQPSSEIAEIVKRKLKSRQLQLPPSLKLEIYQDHSKALKSVISNILENAFIGFILVVITISLLLDLRLAFWVAMGIPVSLLGTLLFLPIFDVSINMISLFAFVLVLGVVVDDAIVVGENIFSHFTKGKSRFQAAVDGATEVAPAIIFAALTTIAAFLPLLFLDGALGDIVREVPIIVITVLLVSVIESLLLLPYHLFSSSGKKDIQLRRVGLLRNSIQKKVDALISGFYRGKLSTSIKFRYTTIATAIGILIICFGFIVGGHTQIELTLIEDNNVAIAQLKMPVGTPVEATQKVMDKIVLKAKSVAARFDQANENRSSAIQHILYRLGQNASTSTDTGDSHVGSVELRLEPEETRGFTVQQFIREWREATGEFPGVAALTFGVTGAYTGKSINIQLEHTDLHTLKYAVNRLKTEMMSIDGVRDVEDNLTDGKRELSFELLPGAKTLGITKAELGRQIRSAFSGTEILRILSKRDEIKVIIRYPKEKRRSIDHLNSFRLRTMTGGEIPLDQVVRVIEGISPRVIQRVNQKRVLNVTADVDRKEAAVSKVLSKIINNTLITMEHEVPGLSYSIAGAAGGQRESMNSLYRGLVCAIVPIYLLIAILLKSYIQPLIVMSAIPFSFIGAVLGHFVLSYSLSFSSLCGLVALAGIVVNDSLILITTINSNKRSGQSPLNAVLDGACARFRAILLTSVTTFVGLFPLIMLGGASSKFFIPMAISLGFGALFCAGATLLVVPSLYMILNDTKTKQD